jgi:hypothetical protein
MTRKVTLSAVAIATLLWIGFISVMSGAEEIRWDQEKLHSVLKSEIKRVSRMTQNPILIEAVVSQNAEGLTMELIKQRDEHWKTSDTSDEFKQEMIASTAGRYLSNLMKSSKAYTEAFLTDNQGANVAASPLTSDYWQGDEDKWVKSFSPEGGAIYVGPMEWDDSSGYNAVQISVPVKQENNVIGVMVVGVKLSHVLAKQLQGL